MDTFLVALASLSGIIFTYWFFLMKKEDKPVVITSSSIDVIVDGGYSPNVISIPLNKEVTFNFIRKDPSSCLEEVVLPDFKIKKYLPLNIATQIHITPTKRGEFEMSCGMNMFHGKIIVQ